MNEGTDGIYKCFAALTELLKEITDSLIVIHERLEEIHPRDEDEYKPIQLPYEGDVS